MSSRSIHIVVGLPNVLEICGTPSYRTVAIIVLGDIGRSPRMMYHAESFASHGFNTYIIAYKGTFAPSRLSGGEFH
jgi:beta-1,4-mannosyltransferase